MEKFFKSISGNSTITVALMLIVVLFIWDQYHSKTMFGLFAPKTPAA